MNPERTATRRENPGQSLSARPGAPASMFPGVC